MKPVSAKTRKEDERLRQELENVDPEKLKQAIKPLLNTRSLGSKTNQKRNH